MPTAIHIGDGNELQYGFDFFADGEDVYVLDIEGLVYEAQKKRVDNEELINAISEKRIRSFAKNQKIDLKHISLRNIDNCYHYKFDRGSKIKTQIHDAFGWSYIPGSSIKGAIRTAVVATMAQGKKMTPNDLMDVEQNLCGYINSDFFRFIRVGDAVFSKECEIVASLSRLTQKDEYDIKQYVESISLKKAGWTTFALVIDSENYKAVKKSGAFGNKLGHMPDEVQNIGSLLKLINDHTIKLVKDEIDKWRKFNNNSWAQNYVETLMRLLKECNSVDSGKECVLRIGMGSGKRFITGAWSESIRRFYNKERHKMENNLAPQTRAVIIGDNSIDLLGFVKLRIKAVKEV